MHGRLKVKTTEEQQKAKQDERAKKIKLYNAATKRAFQKRAARELDRELLDITGQVLQANPDFYTFWNIRKETFLHIQQTVETDEIQKQYRDELEFLEMCLKVNPKSYGTWHHRCFVMDHMPKPDWTRELELCNLFLQYDERNFHCWDYRRFVVSRSKLPPLQEFNFTTSKIESNFSNFSSWHYRSKLLPLLHPDHASPSGIILDVMESEFELVHNGMFTDPNDQSNWFYHKWLLGRGEKQQQINYAYVCCRDKRIMISLTNAVKISTDNCHVLMNGSEVQILWSNHKGNFMYSTLWVGSLTGTLPSSDDQGDVAIQVQIQVLDGAEHVCECKLSLPGGKEEAAFRWSPSDTSVFFRREFSGVGDERLQTELQTIRELQEEETDNKWAMLTTVLLMKAVDPVSHQELIMKFLQQLQTLDTPRISYYCDLRSRFIVEMAIESSHNPKKLCLKGENLTRMHRTELLPLLQELDLSNNALQHVCGFSFLHSLQCLNLSHNKLRSCRGLTPMPCLTSLSLSNNLISTVEDLEFLQLLPKLSSLDLSCNPLCDDPCAVDKLREILPSVKLELTNRNS